MALMASGALSSTRELDAALAEALGKRRPVYVDARAVHQLCHQQNQSNSPLGPALKGPA